MARSRHDQQSSEVMTGSPIALEADTSIREAARQMREADTGAMLVTEGGGLGGILTDRDIAIRGEADGLDPEGTSAIEIASRGISALAPTNTVEDAIGLMRQENVRRVPIVEGDRPVGILSLGDLAMERDEESVLADISSAPGNA
jgi:CBS domain-containing protein